MKIKYNSIPLSFNRRMVRASASVTRKKNTIHSLAEVDITEPRRRIREYQEKTGTRLSFTAYIVACLAIVLKDHPNLNSFIKGNRLIILEDLTISVLIERDFKNEKTPEPLGIQQAQLKSYRQINDEIRAAQEQSGSNLGDLSNMTWVRIIPGILMKLFVRIADRNLRLAQKYGKVAVTAVGMFSKDPVWFIPHGSATVLITVGSISNKTVEIEGRLETREHLCLTASFDHDIVDGAPAARFMNQFLKRITDGSLIEF